MYLFKWQWSDLNAWGLCKGNRYGKSGVVQSVLHLLIFGCSNHGKNNNITTVTENRTRFLLVTSLLGQPVDHEHGQNDMFLHWHYH